MDSVARRECGRALRRGEPPADPSFDGEVAGLIERRRRFLWFDARVCPWIFGFFALLDFVRVMREPDLIGYWGTAFFLTMLVITPVTVITGRRKLDRLEDAIAARREAVPPR